MRQWISAWGYQAMDFSRFPLRVENETLCVQFLNNVRGNALRLLFSNRWSAQPMVLERAELLRMKQPCAWKDAVRTEVTLEGKERIEIPAFTELFSDAVQAEVLPGEYLAVCIYFKEKQEICTGCSCFLQEYNQVFVWPGDAVETLSETDSDFSKEYGHSRVLKTGLLELEPEHQCFCGAVRLELQTEDEVKTLTCFGDSITHRSLWTGPLAMRLYQRYPGKLAMVNCGISGNRILHDESPFSEFGPWFGKAALGRFNRDVLQETGADLITVLLGINDIFHPLVGHAPKEQTVTAVQLQEGLKAIIEQAHASGAKIVGCTITPWKNCLGLFAEEPEQVRKEVNEWIRESGCYDLVLDFDRMIADPQDPERMLPACDSGDHVHPGSIGGSTIAEKIDPGALGRLLGLEEIG